MNTIAMEEPHQYDYISNYTSDQKPPLPPATDKFDVFPCPAYISTARTTTTASSAAAVGEEAEYQTVPAVRPGEDQRSAATEYDEVVQGQRSAEVQLQPGGGQISAAAAQGQSAEYMNTVSTSQERPPAPEESHYEPVKA